MSKSTEKSTEKQIISNNSLFDIPESIVPDDKRVFYPNAYNKPPPTKTVISFEGSKFLTTGNLSSIISRAGTGKSSILEGIIASYLNPQCDGLGFKVNLTGSRNKILLIDGERTQTDTWNSWERLMKRAGVEITEVVPLIVANMKPIGIQKRIEYVTEILVKNTDIGLIILDGGGDFIMDTNSISDTNDLKNWIYSFNPQISVLVTIHTNPENNKPRGHTGSELLRISEGVVLARKIDDEIREITTSFEHGKIRNDNDRNTHYYEWDIEEGMFVSNTDYVKVDKPKKDISDKYTKFIEDIFKDADILSFSQVCDQYSCKMGTKMGATKVSVSRNIIPHLKKVEGGYSQVTF